MFAIKCKPKARHINGKTQPLSMCLDILFLEPAGLQRGGSRMRVITSLQVASDDVTTPSWCGETKTKLRKHKTVSGVKID